MQILSQINYIANVVITDPITGEEAIASLKATKYPDGKIDGFVCGIPYEQVKETLNPQVEQAYQEFITQIPTN